MRRDWRPVALVALVWFIYAQTLGFGFVNYDDDGYVTSNVPVLNGLTVNSVIWAFSNLDRFYWHPLTWLSLMGNVELCGPAPGPMHAVNVALHSGTAVVLYLFLRRVTGFDGRSFVVAGLFAAHPLRVESVAWIAERKDVLSALLTTGALLTYDFYVRKPSPRRYAALLAMFTGACMAKPMAITLPIVLLLLDYWPLKRRAFCEKLPLLAIAAAFAVLTYVGAGRMGALQMLEPAPFTVRLQNAIWSVGQYLRQTFLPHGFSIVYPYPAAFPGVTAIALMVIAVTGIAVWQRRARPWVLIGWLWFVVGLAPTLGLIQAGVQARADRFTYIPHVGLLLAVVWLSVEFLPLRFHTPIAAMSIAALTTISHGQASVWRSSEAVFAQALANTSNNWLAEHKYGLALLERKDVSGAEHHLRRAAELDLADPHSRYQLGRIAAAGRRFPEALELFTETARLKPDYADAHYARALMLVSLGRPSEAVQAFDRAGKLGLAPEWAYQAHIRAGVLLARDGRFPEAERQFRSALNLQPKSIDAQQKLAQAQEQLRHTINGKSPVR